MIEYDIVHETYYAEFVDRVNQKIKDGWKLQGGVAIVANDGGNTKNYAQAITREIVETLPMTAHAVSRRPVSRVPSQFAMAN